MVDVRIERSVSVRPRKSLEHWLENKIRSVCSSSTVGIVVFECLDRNDDGAFLVLRWGNFRSISLRIVHGNCSDGFGRLLSSFNRSSVCWSRDEWRRRVDVAFDDDWNR
jgi:hypothetical protein